MGGWSVFLAPGAQKSDVPGSEGKIRCTWLWRENRVHLGVLGAAGAAKRYFVTRKYRFWSENRAQDHSRIPKIFWRLTARLTHLNIITAFLAQPGARNTDPPLHVQLCSWRNLALKGTSRTCFWRENNVYLAVKGKYSSSGRRRRRQTVFCELKRWFWIENRIYNRITSSTFIFSAYRAFFWIDSGWIN